MNWPDFILAFVVGAFVGLLIGLLAGALMALASEFDYRAQVRRRLMNGDYVKPANNAHLYIIFAVGSEAKARPPDKPSNSISFSAARN